MSQNFNPTNPDSLLYNNGILQLTALGGIKLDGLDRMRTTLKVELVESPRPPLRHNLDLYNDVQVEKFIRKIAERLEVGTSIAEASLSELTYYLEAYRLERIKETEDDTYQPKKLTTEEAQAANEFLEAPNLLDRTNEMIAKAGMVGEETNRLIMFLIFTSRKRTHPLHVVSLGSSGTGKTHLQEKVGELIPEEDKIEITTLSENAFYYFERRALSNKLILIEDLDGAESSLFPLRELQSKKRISKTVAHKNSKGETRSVHLVVEGPVSVAGCTTKEQIYEDNANRSFLLYLDESPEQDTRIMASQRAEAAGQIDHTQQEEAAQLMRNCQRLLQPVKVVNPFAEKLQIPKEVFKPRRTNGHYLQFIEAITFYHQVQREKKYDNATGEEYIETTLEDIAAANELMKGVLIRKSDTLTGACRNYFEKLKLLVLGNEKMSITNTLMSQLLRIPLTTIKRYHLDLSINGYLRTNKEKGSKAHQYEIVSLEEFRELQMRITTVLDESLKELQAQLGEVKKGEKNLKSPTKPKSPKQPSKVSGLMKASAVVQIEQ